VGSGARHVEGELVLFWPRDLAEAAREARQWAKDAAPGQALWVVIPKKPIAVARGSDLLFDAVQRVVLETGLVDNKSLTFSDEEYGIRYMPRTSKGRGGGGL